MILLTENEKNYIENLSNFNDSVGFPDLYIVGGFVRDKLLNKTSKDIDVTVNSGSKSFVLGMMYSSKKNFAYKIRSGTHISVFADEIIFDFSSANISESLRGNNSSIKKETISRDFTINSLLFNPRTKKIIDLTGKGVSDIENKIIRTNLKPEITFSDDSKRIIRSLLYATKLGFSLHEDIVEYLTKNKDFVRNALFKNKKFFGNTIAECLNYDQDRTIKFLKDTESFHLVPLVGSYKNILIKRKLLDEYFRKNDDDLTNDALDLGSPVNAVNQFVQGHPSSVPNSYVGDGYKDDNNRDMYRGLPYLT